MANELEVISEMAMMGHQLGTAAETVFNHATPAQVSKYLNTPVTAQDLMKRGGIGNGLGIIGGYIPLSLDIDPDWEQHLPSYRQKDIDASIDATPDMAVNGQVFHITMSDQPNVLGGGTLTETPISIINFDAADGRFFVEAAVMKAKARGTYTPLAGMRQAIAVFAVDMRWITPGQDLATTPPDEVRSGIWKMVDLLTDKDPCGRNAFVHTKRKVVSEDGVVRTVPVDYLQSQRDNEEYLKLLRGTEAMVGGSPFHGFENEQELFSVIDDMCEVMHAEFECQLRGIKFDLAASLGDRHDLTGPMIMAYKQHSETAADWSTPVKAHIQLLEIQQDRRVLEYCKASLTDTEYQASVRDMRDRAIKLRLEVIQAIGMSTEQFDLNSAVEALATMGKAIKHPIQLKFSNIDQVERQYVETLALDPHDTTYHKRMDAVDRLNDIPDEAELMIEPGPGHAMERLDLAGGLLSRTGAPFYYGDDNTLRINSEEGSYMYDVAAGIYATGAELKKHPNKLKGVIGSFRPTGAEGQQCRLLFIDLMKAQGRLFRRVVDVGFLTDTAIYGKDIETITQSDVDSEPATRMPLELMRMLLQSADQPEYGVIQTLGNDEEYGGCHVVGLTPENGNYDLPMEPAIFTENEAIILSTHGKSGRLHISKGKVTKLHDIHKATGGKRMRKDEIARRFEGKYRVTETPSARASRGTEFFSAAVKNRRLHFAAPGGNNSRFNTMAMRNERPKGLNI